MLSLHHFLKLCCKRMKQLVFEIKLIHLINNGGNRVEKNF